MNGVVEDKKNVNRLIFLFWFRKIVGDVMYSVYVCLCRYFEGIFKINCVSSYFFVCVLSMFMYLLDINDFYDWS